MKWTFDIIAGKWSEIAPLPMAIRERQIAPFVSALTGSERGWFRACRAWAHGGPSPDDYPEIPEVIEALGEYRGMVAELHVACARIVREMLYPNDKPDWTAESVLSQDEDTDLRERLALLSESFADLGPHLGLAFLYDLACEFLDCAAPTMKPRMALFPMVWTGDPPSGTPQEPLVVFVLEGLPGYPGQEPFFDPAQAFVPIEKSFCRIFRDAPQALKASGVLPETVCAVRVRIEWWHKSDGREDSLIYHANPLFWLPTDEKRQAGIEALYGSPDFVAGDVSRADYADATDAPGTGPGCEAGGRKRSVKQGCHGVAPYRQVVFTIDLPVGG